MSRYACAPLGLVVMLLAGSVAPETRGTVAVAWLRHGRVETPAGSPSPLPAAVPLGSTWKLFVYAYAVEQGRAMPPYRCGGVPRAEDMYCCEPGNAIDADTALARSCSAFFSPERLGIEASVWAGYWSRRTTPESAWLTALDNLRPDLHLPVSRLLHAARAVPPSARVAAARALLPVVIDGYGRGATARVGGLLRVKTFTWDDPRHPGRTFGGGLGWLVDGTPIWFGGAGSSRTVLRDHAEEIGVQLPAPQGGPVDEPCVGVRYFERYPIAGVDRLPGGRAAGPGPMDGQYRVRFANGNVVTLSSAGELTLERPADAPARIVGRLPLSEYVARVVDREAEPTVVEASRALAVVARTWTMQNAVFERGCYQVADSTRMQRVSASPATPAARQAAWFTDGLVLDGEQVRYHRDRPAPAVMAWTAAVADARAGRTYDDILARSFPRASLAALSGARECRRLDEATAWLMRVSRDWRRRLAAEPGFEPPDPLVVCALDRGRPFADRARQRVYVRGVASRDERVALAHEYLHTAFQYHPTGQDESFIESMARALVP